MNGVWIFLTVLIGVIAAIVVFIVGLIVGFEVSQTKMDSDLNKLIDNYKGVVNNNTKFFKDMADAINKLSR